MTMLINLSPQVAEAKESFPTQQHCPLAGVSTRVVVSERMTLSWKARQIQRGTTVAMVYQTLLSLGIIAGMT